MTHELNAAFRKVNYVLIGSGIAITAVIFGASLYAGNRLDARTKAETAKDLGALVAPANTVSGSVEASANYIPNRIPRTIEAYKEAQKVNPEAVR